MQKIVVLGFLTVFFGLSGSPYASEVVNFSDNQLWNMHAQVNERYIGWIHADYPQWPYAANGQVWVYDLKRGNRIELDNSKSAKAWLKLKDNWAFWLEDYSGYYGYPSYTKIAGKNIVGGERRILLDLEGTGSVVFAFDISKDHLAWIEDVPDQDPYTWDNSGFLHLVDRHTGVEQVLGTASTRVAHVALMYDFVAWGYGSIYTYHIPTQTFFRQGFYGEFPTFWSDKVYYANGVEIYPHSYYNRIFEQDLFDGSFRIIFQSQSLISRFIPQVFGRFGAFHQELSNGISYNGQVWGGYLDSGMAQPLSPDRRGTYRFSLWGNWVVWPYNSKLIQGIRINNISAPYILAELDKAWLTTSNFPTEIRRWLRFWQIYLRYLIAHNRYLPANRAVLVLQQHLWNLNKQHRLPSSFYRARARLWAIYETTRT